MLVKGDRDVAQAKFPKAFYLWTVVDPETGKVNHEFEKLLGTNYEKTKTKDKVLKRFEESKAVFVKLNLNFRSLFS